MGYQERQEAKDAHRLVGVMCVNGHEQTDRDFRIYPTGRRIPNCHRCAAENAERKRRARGAPVRGTLSLAEKRKRSRDFVKAIRQCTYCELCGRQPIEWHRIEHDVHHDWRVSALAQSGRTPERILAEIALCQALCRSCHTKVDGRNNRRRKQL